MTLTVGDNLIIRRNGQLLDPTKEAYVEYEVVEQPTYDLIAGSGMQTVTFVTVRLKVVK